MQERAGFGVWRPGSDELGRQDTSPSGAQGPPSFGKQATIPPTRWHRDPAEPAETHGGSAPRLAAGICCRPAGPAPPHCPNCSSGTLCNDWHCRALARVCTTTCPRLCRRTLRPALELPTGLRPTPLACAQLGSVQLAKTLLQAAKATACPLTLPEPTLARYHGSSGTWARAG